MSIVDEELAHAGPAKGLTRDGPWVACVLVVDDDPEIVGLLRRGLSYNGYRVETATNGKEALERAVAHEPDLVVLDIMMPGMDGLEVSRRLRAGGRVPILLLTAKGTVEDRVAGLECGADDYLVKPFALDELLARVRALIRRARPSASRILRFADLSLDTVTREVSRGGNPVELTRREFNILEAFMKRPRQVLSRDSIDEQVWGEDFEGESNIIDVYIRYIRSKLEAHGESRLIQTVRGFGYVLRE